MEEARANSMRIHFGPGKREPTDHEIFHFMKVKMNLKSESLLSMYKEPKEHCVYIKFKAEELLKQALLRLPTSLEFPYDKYESTTVTFSAASSVFRYVRIFALPPEIDDKEISVVLAKYGVIQRMVREKYGAETGFPIWTTVRGVHMDIKEDIPATIHVRNYQARIFYDGLQNKCFVCGSTEHVKVNCPKRIERDQQKEKSGGSSYSDVVARPARWSGRAGKKTETQSNASGGNNGRQGEGSSEMTNLNLLLNKPNVPSLSNDPIVPNVPVIPKLPVPSAPNDPNKPGNPNPEQSEQSEQAAASQTSSAAATSAAASSEAATSAAASSEAASSAAADSGSSPMIVEQDDNSTPNKTKTTSEESEFRVVESKRRKQAIRSQSSDTKVKASEQGTSSIPKLNFSATQSILTRGREKQRKSGGTRSRSRSGQGGKSPGKVEV